jgi:glycosyltransferase involved in cell wall biosynthesis
MPAEPCPGNFDVRISMKVVISTIGTFHYVNLALEMAALGHEVSLFSAYPIWKLQHRYPLGQSSVRVRTFAWVRGFYMIKGRFGLHGKFWEKTLSYFSQQTFDRFVSARMPECDVFIGQARTSLLSGRKAQSMGAFYVCDVGSSHIRVFRSIIEAEYRKRGFSYNLIFDDVVRYEEEEYRRADAISVISKFAYGSFVSQGFDSHKLWLNPLGVDLSKFHLRPLPDADKKFTILFVGAISFRKGIPYLLEAVGKLSTPYRLNCVGSKSIEMRRYLKQNHHSTPDVHFPGRQSPDVVREMMNRADVLVLPSIEDGFGMVILEALACGCPVIATRNSGGPEVIEPGFNGFLVDAGDSEGLAEKLERVAGWKNRREQVRQACHRSAIAFGGGSGWTNYAERYVENLVRARKNLVAQ